MRECQQETLARVASFMLGKYIFMISAIVPCLEIYEKKIRMYFANM